MEKYFILEALKTAQVQVSNVSTIYFVNDFPTNLCKVQSVLPDHIVQHILDFISFPLANYLKRIFHHFSRQSVYDYQQLVLESKNDTKQLIPEFMKENVTLIQTWKVCFRSISLTLYL